jgi:hypothetical protein
MASQVRFRYRLVALVAGGGQYSCPSSIFDFLDFADPNMFSIRLVAKDPRIRALVQNSLPSFTVTALDSILPFLLGENLI